MTRETKVGLLIGLGVILLIGIIVSDYLSVAQLQEPAGQAMTEFGPRAADTIQTDRRAGYDSLAETTATIPRRAQPIPTPAEFATPAGATAQPQPRPDAPLARADDGMTGYVPLLRSDREATPAPAPQAQVIPTPAELTLDEIAPPPPLFAPRTAAAAPLDVRDRQAPPVVDEAPTRVAPDRPQPARSTIVHHVAEGESLFQIAQKYYGDGEQWPTIVKHNPQRVRDNGHVGVGVRLILPAQPDGRTTEVIHAANQALATSARTIDVREGDTLIGLAKQHLGDGGRWKDLLAANAGKLDDPKDLRVGMTLNLPASSTTIRASTPRSTTATSAAAGSYTVKSGDTLYRIAESALGDGDRWQEIFKANRDQLASPDNLKVGQTLRLPS